MSQATTAVYVQGASPPYAGRWTLARYIRYPDAAKSWEDAQLFIAEASLAHTLFSLNDALRIERMIRDKVKEEGGGSLESLILRRVDRDELGTVTVSYKVYHAAHGSPIVWVAIVPWIVANWPAILILLGMAAAAVAVMAFTIRSVDIIWKVGDKVSDLIDEAPAAVVGAGLGAGLLIIVALFALSRRK